MEGVVEIGTVNFGVGVKIGDEGTSSRGGKGSHFVLTFVDGTGSAVFLTVGHGIADGDPPHEFANPSLTAASVFGEHQVEMVGEEEETMESAREGAGPRRAPLFGSQSFGVQARYPGQRGTVREAEVITHGENKTFEVSRVGEEDGAGFGLVAEMVGDLGHKVAEKEFAWHRSTMA